ncbi:hypothetical protein J5N97_027146 [Dioscorea zingiberensis]|uniref:Uncharacterized protein n=1 Tax=Dioscorea zingiberensis TaxID=325984 RepID=A0A9D5C473_9LILI|nr:hypothetical protein J5N97_027146 [Dioscorea zingiberensis]
MAARVSLSPGSPPQLLPPRLLPSGGLANGGLLLLYPQAILASSSWVEDPLSPSKWIEEHVSSVLIFSCIVHTEKVFISTYIEGIQNVIFLSNIGQESFKAESRGTWKQRRNGRRSGKQGMHSR